MSVTIIRYSTLEVSRSRPSVTSLATAPHLEGAGATVQSPRREGIGLKRSADGQSSTLAGK